MTRPTLIDVNPIEFNYCSFMISLDKCNLSCNFVDGLSMKVCAPSQIKDVNVKVFNVITRMYEAKALVKHISCNCKCKFSGTTCNSNQKWNIRVNSSVKSILHSKKIIAEILVHVFVKITSIYKV